MCLVAALVLGGSGRASELNFRISPSLLEFTFPAGGSDEATVTLVNGSPDPLEIRAEVRDWTMDIDGPVRFAKPGTVGSACAAGVSVQPRAVSIPAGGKKTVTVGVSLPPGATGTCWAAVLFRSPRRPARIDGQEVDVDPRVGLVLYATASGTEKTEIALTEASGSNSSELWPAQLTAQVENRGNTAVRFRVTWQVKPADGSPVPILEEKGLVVLPRASRRVRLAVPKEAPLGLHPATLLIRWGNRRWLSGETRVLVTARPSKKERV